MPSIPSLTTVAAALLTVAPSVFAGKRGLAWPWYNEGINLDPAKLAGSNVQFIYN
ncbi:hypothetical protein FRC12_002546 [Ceratobasidium sp. 428]|nr:hypothetical protein FRC12_002546 [Ceratobasidium sp. 428]